MDFFPSVFAQVAGFSAGPDLTMTKSGETVICRTDMRIDRHRWVALVGFVVALCAAQPAYAETAKADAKAHFKAGQTHYNLNEYVEALGEFKAAYRLFPDPVFLYNLAQCERRLGHYDEAIRFYRSYLREQPEAPNRAEVQRKIDEMETAQTSRGGDAEERSVAPPAAVEPAKPEVTVPPAEAGPAGESKPPSVVHVPAPAADEPAPMPAMDLTSSSAPPAVEHEPSAFYGRWWFWTTVGVVAAGAGVGLYLMTGQTAAGPNAALGSRKVF